MIHKVQEFHQKFGLPLGDEDVLTGIDNLEVTQYRIDFLTEELVEFIHAMKDQDRVKAFDALLDLVYVAQGTALFLGVDPKQWMAGMDAVQQANMSKERAVLASDSKRGSTFDVVKPKGWKGPEDRLREILNWDLYKD